MGILRNLFRKRMQDPVRGSAQVVSRSVHSGEAVWESCRMQLVVEAPGVIATPVEWVGLVHNKKWPGAGIMLPVTIDRADPTRVNIEWDEVETNAEISRREAEKIAAAKRGGGMLARAAAADDDSETEERIEQLERLARLHEQGVPSDAELAEQKRQILDA